MEEQAMARTEPSVWRAENGDPERVLHFRAGLLHRDIFPAVRRFKRTSKGLRTTHHEYWNDGQRDRKAGPAWIRFDPETGAPIEERWLRKEDLHRDKGPAVLTRGKDGKIHEEWWRNGKQYQPTLSERAQWNATKARQGAPWHRDSVRPILAFDLDGDLHPSRPIADAAAKAKREKSSMKKPGRDEAER
jgi:hypothetical protein